MLSQKAKYGLRALVELARAAESPGGAQVSAGELAARAGAPRKFLEAILLELSRNQVVVSRRGKFGGYVLARPAPEITFAEIIRIIDGPWRWRPASPLAWASGSAPTVRTCSPARCARRCCGPATRRRTYWRATPWRTRRPPGLRSR